MRLIFYNKSDPRVFLYKVPKYKWMGVTLNFAHGKAWLVFLWTLLPVGILLLPLSLTRQLRPSPGWVALWVWLFVVWLVGVLIYYFCMAAKEERMLRDCPGKIKNRVHWLWWVIGLAALAAYGLVIGWMRI